MNTCLICNREFKNKNALCGHFRSHKITAKDYYDKFFKKSNEGLCRVCNKPTPFLGLNNGYAIHCGYTCGMKDPINRKYRQSQIEIAMMNKYGFKTNLHNPEVRKKLNSNEAIQKCKKTMLKHFGYESVFQRPDVIASCHSASAERKRRKSYLENSGYAHPFLRPDVLKAAKYSRYHTKPIKGLDYNRNTHYYNSKVELNFANKLRELQIEFIPHYLSNIYPFECDFYLVQSKTFIEINVHITHGDHAFDSTSEQDLNILNDLYKKANIIETKTNKKSMYSTYIEVWTKRDVEKRKIAKKQNLNYVELFSEQEINLYLKQLEEN